MLFPGCQKPAAYDNPRARQRPTAGFRLSGSCVIKLPQLAGRFPTRGRGSCRRCGQGEAGLWRRERRDAIEKRRARGTRRGCGAPVADPKRIRVVAISVLGARVRRARPVRPGLRFQRLRSSVWFPFAAYGLGRLKKDNVHDGPAFPATNSSISKVLNWWTQRIDYL